jgi:hypothetical protein
MGHGDGGGGGEEINTNMSQLQTNLLGLSKIPLYLPHTPYTSFIILHVQQVVHSLQTDLTFCDV